MMKRADAKAKQVLSKITPPSATTKLSAFRDAEGQIGARNVGMRPSGTTKGSGALTKKPNAASVDPHVAEYAEVLAHAVETFGSRTNANAWLNRSNRIFNNKSPLQILTQDPAAVEEELVRIDHGMFA